MSEEHIVTLIAAVIASGLLTTLVNWILHRIDRQEIERKNLVPPEQMENLRFGVETLLFQQLEAIHTHTLQSGYCNDELKRVADRTYRAYHGLGGNGMGTQMWDDIMKSKPTPQIRLQEVNEHVQRRSTGSKGGDGQGYGRDQHSGSAGRD